MPSYEMIDILYIVDIDYLDLLMQGVKIGLILGGSISIIGYGINTALRLFKII